ncbi:MAG: endonuclease/exonuclease/phosphatase family protein [Paludibacteraceae bacterium]|nr:endonuclease/exonuclease/phosphatase family protein [Paludibacteraceae bacterium]
MPSTLGGLFCLYGVQLRCSLARFAPVCDAIRAHLSARPLKLVQRAEQVQIIRGEIDRSPHPVIVCGDFNDVPASYTYRHLSEGLNDAFLSTSFLRTGHTFVMRCLGVRIDYILHSDKLNAIDFCVNRVPYSDHYPVSATLTWE